MEKKSVAECENETLNFLIETEDLAEKKARIYSKLLTDQTLASEMERLAKRHVERRESLELLLYGKISKKSKKEEQAEEENED